MDRMRSHGDMPVNDFREYAHEMADWIADYLGNIENYPVVPDLQPGDIKSKLPNSPPEKGEAFDHIFPDLDKIILPGITHWNHPNFMAYFNSTSSGPGILAEFLTAAFNVNGMLWKTCPAATELEEITINWFRQMLGLPEKFWGIIYDTASVSTLHAIAAARENINGYNFREKGFVLGNMPPLRLYTSEFAHSSVEKAAIMLGLGLEGVKKIKCNERFEMLTRELEKNIVEDTQNGWLPFCVVGTVGTTSVTSIDPIEEIAEICKKYNLWLHVDAAYGGSAAIVPEKRNILKGVEFADSLVYNPHKWLFHPIDISVLFTTQKDILKRAFSLIPEYLKTNEDDSVDNLMDYGIQLGRRFRALKPWFIIRYFGIDGLTEILREHLHLAKMFQSFIEDSPDFELMAPVTLSTVCFRARAPKEVDINNFNKELLDKINSTGKLLLTQTKIGDRFIIRLVVSGIHTKQIHVENAWQLINSSFQELIKEKK